MEHGIIVRTDGRKRKVDVGGDDHRGKRGHKENGRQFTNFLREGDLRETIENNRRGNQPPDGDGEPDLRVYLQQLKSLQKRHLIHDNDLNDLGMDDPMDQFHHPIYDHGNYREQNSEMDMCMHHGHQFEDIHPHLGPSDSRGQKKSVEKYDNVQDRSDRRDRRDNPNNMRSSERRNRSLSPGSKHSSSSYNLDRRGKRQTDTSGRCGSRSDLRRPEEFPVDDFDHYPPGHYERRDEYPEDFDRMHPHERFLKEESYRRRYDERQGRKYGDRVHDDERNHQMIYDDDQQADTYPSSRFEEVGRHGRHPREGRLMHRRERIDEVEGMDWSEKNRSHFAVQVPHGGMTQRERESMLTQRPRRYQLHENDRSGSERNRHCQDDDYPGDVDRVEYEGNKRPHPHASDRIRYPPDFEERFDNLNRNRLHDNIHEEEMHLGTLGRKHPIEYESFHERNYEEIHHRTRPDDISRYGRNRTHFDDLHGMDYHDSGRISSADLDRIHLGERETMRKRSHLDDEDRMYSYDRVVPDGRQLVNPDGRDPFVSDSRMTSDERDRFDFDPRMNSDERNRFAPDNNRRSHAIDRDRRSPDPYQMGSDGRYESCPMNQNVRSFQMDVFERNSRHHPDLRFEDELRRRDGNQIISSVDSRRRDNILHGKGRSKERISPRQSKRPRSPAGSSDERNSKRRSRESERTRQRDGSNWENQDFPKEEIQKRDKKQEAEVGVHSRESVERHLRAIEGDTSKEMNTSLKSKSSHRSSSNNKHDRNSKQNRIKEFPPHPSKLKLNPTSEIGRSSENDKRSQDHTKRASSKDSKSSEKNKSEKSLQHNSESQRGKSHSSESSQSKKSGKRTAEKRNSGGKGRGGSHSPKSRNTNPQLSKARTPPYEFLENAMNNIGQDKISFRGEHESGQKTGQTDQNKFDLDAEISRSLAAYRKSSEVTHQYHEDTVNSTPTAEDLSEDIDGVPLSNDEYLNLIQSIKEPPKPPAQPTKKTPVSIKLEPLPSRQIGLKSSILAPKFATPGIFLGSMDSSSISNDSFDLKSKYDHNSLSLLSKNPNLMDSAILPSFETEYPYSRSDLQSHSSNQASSNGGVNESIISGNNEQANPVAESSYDAVWEKLPSLVGSSSQSFESRNPQTIPGFGSITEKALAPVLQLDDSYFDALKKTLSKLKDIETGANKDESKSNMDLSGYASASSSDHRINELHLNEFKDLGLEEKLNAIRFFVRYYTKKNVDDVDLIDLAINKDYQGGVKLEKEYKVRVLGQEKERVIFIGTLHIGGQFFSDAIHQFKRECKRLCHAKAVKVCRECTMEEIRTLKQRSPEELKQAMSELIVDLKKTEEEDPLNVMKRFIKSLKNAKNVPMNVISKIMNAVKSSGIGSRFFYTDEMVLGKSGDHLCRGELKVAGITIGISAETSKKKAKAATMEMAYKRLMLYPAEKIVQGLNSKELEEGLAKFNSVVDKDTKNSNLSLLKETMEKFIDTLKMEAADNQSSCLAKIEKFCREFKLSPFCVYKKTDRLDSKRLMIMLCELYINDYFIGSGTGTSRNRSRKEAFDNAYAFMLSTNAQQIILKQRKLTQKDLSSPDVLPFEKNLLAAVKRESNIKLLKNYNPDEITCALKDIVIVETPALVKNRYQNAFKIIQQSCNHAQMLMEWEFEPVGNIFKFHIFIQGQEVSSSNIMAPTKYRAKVLSCAEVLYGFYETQPVIEVIREYDTGGSFSESDIEQQVKMMQMSGMEVDDIPEDVLKEVDEDMDVTKLKWYYAVFNGMFSIYSKEDTLEEITFGPNFKDLFLFKHFKEKYNVRISTVKREGDIYYVATPMLLPAQMYEVLKKSGGESGRYRMVNKLLLPRKVDLQEEIRLAENAASLTDASLINKFRRETENLNKAVTEPSKYILRTASLGKSPNVTLNKPTVTYPAKPLAKSHSSSNYRSSDSVGKEPLKSAMKKGESSSSLPVSGQYYPSYAPNSFSSSP